MTDTWTKNQRCRDLEHQGFVERLLGLRKQVPNMSICYDCMTPEDDTLCPHSLAHQYATVIKDDLERQGITLIKFFELWDAAYPSNHDIQDLATWPRLVIIAREYDLNRTDLGKIITALVNQPKPFEPVLPYMTDGMRQEETKKIHQQLKDMAEYSPPPEETAARLASIMKILGKSAPLPVTPPPQKMPEDCSAVISVLDADTGLVMWSTGMVEEDVSNLGPSLEEIIFEDIPNEKGVYMFHGRAVFGQPDYFSGYAEDWIYKGTYIKLDVSLPGGLKLDI